MKPRRRIPRIFTTLLVVLVFLVIGVLTVGGAAKARLRSQYPPPGQLVDVGGYIQLEQPDLVIDAIRQTVNAAR